MNPRLTMSRWRWDHRRPLRAADGALLNLHALKNIVHLPADDGRRYLAPITASSIVLAYLWPLALVPLLLEKQDPDVQWHAKHGLVLMVADFLIVVYFVFASVVTLCSVNQISVALMMLLISRWVGILAMHVIAILKGVGGARLIIPIVSGYADRF